jgi:hypothetical protein
MAGRGGGRTVGGMNRTPALVLATVALVASYAIGAVIALVTDIGSLADVLTNGTKTSAPFWILVVELGAAYGFLRGRLAGAAVLAVLSALSTAAFAFDGDFANDVLSPGHVAWQSLEAALALVVAALALRALIRRPRRPAVA